MVVRDDAFNGVCEGCFEADLWSVRVYQLTIQTDCMCRHVAVALPRLTVWE